MNIKTKQSATEFEMNQLPHNRKQVFWDVIKLHWRMLLVLSLVLLVGLLPLLTCLFIRDQYALVLAARVNDGTMSPEDRLATLKIVYLICAGACWVCLYIFALAVCIVVRFVRQLIWYEPIFVKEDIAMGIKNGYKGAAICSTFAGIIIVVHRLMLFVTDNVFVQIIPVAIFIPFIALPLLLAFIQSTIYIGSFSQMLKNAIAMYIKEAPIVLLFGLLLFTPLLFTMLEQFLIVKYIVVVVYIYLFELAFIMMFSLGSNYIFDKYINKEQFPQMYKKGLYVESNK